MDPADYCREVEAYLCRKNDGHLIRIVGPAFERVSGWAEQGVPLTVVFQGVDRRLERYYAKGPRRRPLRVEFCEADVLDLFDEWRRAVGVRPSATRAIASESGDAGQSSEDQGRSPRGRSGLRSHVDRVVARLTKLRSGPEAVPGLHQVLDRIVDELDTQRAGARASRGDARTRLLERLNVLDQDLMVMARRGTGAALLDTLRRAAEAELAPFRSRMAPVAFEHALENCTDRLLRDRLGLPRVSFD